MPSVSPASPDRSLARTDHPARLRPCAEPHRLPAILSLTRRSRNDDAGPCTSDQQPSARVSRSASPGTSIDATSCRAHADRRAPAARLRMDRASLEHPTRDDRRFVLIRRRGFCRIRCVQLMFQIDANTHFGRLRRRLGSFVTEPKHASQGALKLCVREGQSRAGRSRCRCQ